MSSKTESVFSCKICRSDVSKFFVKEALLNHFLERHTEIYPVARVSSESATVIENPVSETPQPQTPTPKSRKKYTRKPATTKVTENQAPDAKVAESAEFPSSQTIVAQ